MHKLIDKFQCFQTAGVVILDEFRLMTTRTLTPNLLRLKPRYLIGLTATPYRPDAFDVLIGRYFQKDCHVTQTLLRKHLVCLIESPFVPRVEYTGVAGAINWNVLLDSMADDKTRNIMIVNLMCSIPTRTVMCLVKRKRQGKLLVDMLLRRGQTATSLMGAGDKYDRKARILIGTTGKMGVGFDHPKMDTLVLATDVCQYFIQYLGCILRRPRGTPVVIDIVDRNPILVSHWKVRSSVYKKHGGLIRLGLSEKLTTHPRPQY